LNKLKGKKSPSAHAYPPISQGHGCIFISFLFEKKKKTSTQKLKFCVLEDKLISTLQLKKPEQIILSPIILSMSNASR
jgi:hypothetical protein